MANLTLYVPEDLDAEMRRHKEIKWSEVARQAFLAKLDKLAIMDSVLANSTLTGEDAIRIGRKINAGIAKRYKISRKN